MTSEKLSVADRSKYIFWIVIEESNCSWQQCSRHPKRYQFCQFYPPVLCDSMQCCADGVRLSSEKHHLVTPFTERQATFFVKLISLASVFRHTSNMRKIVLSFQNICFILLPFFFVSVPIVRATRVTINNLTPRLDVNGAIVDAHDGSIQQFQSDGLYYIHGMQYGLCEEPPNYGCDGVRSTVFANWAGIKQANFLLFQFTFHIFKKILSTKVEIADTLFQIS
jgi:hypothetical protein